MKKAIFHLEERGGGFIYHWFIYMIGGLRFIGTKLSIIGERVLFTFVGSGYSVLKSLIADSKSEEYNWLTNILLSNPMFLFVLVPVG